MGYNNYKMERNNYEQMPVSSLNNLARERGGKRDTLDLKSLS